MGLVDFGLDMANVVSERRRGGQQTQAPFIDLSIADDFYAHGRSRAEPAAFPTEHASMPTFPAIARRLSRRFEIGGREVLVFDGLYPRRTRELLYRFVRETPFHWNARDSNAAAERHAVRWKHDLVAERATQLPFFADVVALVQGLGVAPKLRVERIYVNFNLYGEKHFAHTDSRTGLTALYCANLEWEPAWQGETFFYAGDEPTHVVLPVPGRLIVFDAALRHRGSPPARDCYEPRINIAFKFTSASRSPTQTRSKRPEVVRPRRG